MENKSFQKCDLSLKSTGNERSQVCMNHASFLSETWRLFLRIGSRLACHEFIYPHVKFGKQECSLLRHINLNQRLKAGYTHQIHCLNLTSTSDEIENIIPVISPMNTYYCLSHKARIPRRRYTYKPPIFCDSWDVKLP